MATNVERVRARHAKQLLEAQQRDEAVRAEVLERARVAAALQRAASEALREAVLAARKGGCSLRAIGAATEINHETIRRLVGERRD